MRHRASIVTIALAGMMVGGLSARLSGQEDQADLPDPDVLVDLHTGIFNYLQGHQDVEEFSHYGEAVELFTSVLERDPGNPTALLFRALCQGRIGLAHRESRLKVGDREVTRIEGIIEIRENPDLRDQYEQEKAEFGKMLADPTLEASSRSIVTLEHNTLETLLFFDKRREDAPIDLLRSEIAEAKVRIAEIARRERRMYIAMLDDLERILTVVDEPEPVIRLLEVVAKTKAARLDEEEAIGLLDGEISAANASGPPEALREASGVALGEAADILESIRSDQLTEEDAIRSKFFLGVIRFRQAVPRQPKKEPVERDMKLLDIAERIMTDIVEDDPASQTWKSYAALYLGLIIPIRAVSESTEAARDEAFDEALSRLTQAAALNIVRPDDGSEPYSYSDGIPLVVSRQRQVIEEAREQPVAAPRFVNDLRFTLSAGVHRDSNVVLLGERTDLPRGIGDKDDYGFRLGFVVDHTLDLGLLDPDLKKWTLGLRGRTSQLWHVQIDTFDEQDYGGSIALQYELVGEEDGRGPVFAQFQYDFDYTLLGRQPFVSTNALSWRIRSYRDERRGSSDVYFRFEIRDYSEPLFDGRFNRDGHYFRLGFFHSHKMLDMTPIIEGWGMPVWGHENDDAIAQEDGDYPARYLTPFVGFEYGWDSTAGDEFDLRQYKFTLGAIVPLAYGLQLDTTVDFTWEDYLADGSLVDFHRRGREDFIQRYEIGLSRTYVLREGTRANRYNAGIDRTVMTVRGFAAWTLDDSNVLDRSGQAIFEYDRVAYGINVAFSFN